VRELLEVMDGIDVEEDADGVGLVQDFQKPKTFLHFDPYGDAETGLSDQTLTDS